MSSEKAVFDFSNYKQYLVAKLGAKSARKGLKTALAKALSCQPTYVSQVLNGHAHFSSEQAIDLNEFFGHSQEESHYFMLLVQKDRAGKSALRKYYQDQLQEILDRRMNITKRLGGASNQLNEEQKAFFYSSWHYLAIFLALSVPELRTKQRLAQHFHLPLKRVVSVLEFLVGAGLARQVGEHFEADSTLLRVASDSAHIQKHHTNWRMQAIESLERDDLNDLHYSAVVSLSRADIRVIKDRLLEQIKNHVAMIRESKEEEVCVLCVDFFNLQKR